MSSRRRDIKGVRAYERLLMRLSESGINPIAATDIKEMVKSYMISVEGALQMVGTIQAHELAKRAPELVPLAAVPSPEDAIDYLVAWQRSRDDLRQYERMIEAKPAIETLVRIHINMTEWAWFWAVRERTEAARDMFAEAALVGEAQLAEIDAKVVEMMERRA